MKAKIYITYKDGILDPEGTTVNKAFSSMGLKGINSVQIGKYIEISFDNMSKEQAKAVTDESCRKLLANPNTETYSFEIVEE